ncbi:exonuclease 3'-5' domain-containing protein 2 isoform X3 [Narcine bancroftii]|uniref:exonuclease 3'-5' domain-containing protein 2 isoform X3 n=1 Tax=Narcine bancroftii TaxID=1343680 RepID=UPI003831C6C9
MSRPQALAMTAATLLGTAVGCLYLWRSFRSPKWKRALTNQNGEAVTSRERTSPNGNEEACHLTNANDPLNPSPLVRKILAAAVFVVESDMDWEQVWPLLRTELDHYPVIGFDCEWVSVKGKANPVSLLQIATYSGSCFLLRMPQLTRGNCLLPKALLHMLGDDNILKVGVEAFEDGCRLLRDYCVMVKSCLDVRYLVTHQRKNNLTYSLSLKSLAQEIIHFTLDKSLHLRCSNWEAEELTNEQQLPDFTMHLGAIYDGHLTYQSTQLCDEGENCRKLIWSLEECGNRHHQRKSPLYDNCFLHAPDGQPLCTCDRKKAQWYIDKGIGELISKEPFIVKLKFEPSGRPESQQDYYLITKQNLCVVCGKKESYIRKNIVPHEYRKHFPIQMKDHNSHDVLLLCTACHAASNCYDNILKQQLAKEFSAPIGCEESVRIWEDPVRRQVRSGARALLHADSLPDTRREELQDILRAFFNVETLTEELVEEGTELETRIFNENHVPHGLKVTQACAVGGLRALMSLEKRWRQHFLDYMQPQHLPPLWSVDHNHSKLLRKYGEDLKVELT